MKSLFRIKTKNGTFEVWLPKTHFSINILCYFKKKTQFICWPRTFTNTVDACVQDQLVGVLIPSSNNARGSYT